MGALVRKYINGIEYESKSDVHEKDFGWIDVNIGPVGFSSFFYCLLVNYLIGWLIFSVSFFHQNQFFSNLGYDGNFLLFLCLTNKQT